MVKSVFVRFTATSNTELKIYRYKNCSIDYIRIYHVTPYINLHMSEQKEGIRLLSSEIVYN